MVERLNTPNADRATGITAPLIRAAAHVGYIMGYLEEMNDETWNEHRDELFSDMSRELNEGIAHLRESGVAGSNPFVSSAVTDVLAAIRTQMDSLRVVAPETKAGLIRDLQNINHNIAHAGALCDRDTAGLDNAHEGLIT